MPSSALGAVRLADWGVIRAQGEEAAKFLHTQLTQDLALQTTAQARLAGYCSAKGRLLATLLALKPDDRSVLLALPADVLPATVKRLSMFVLRAKCQLSDDSAAWAVWGLSGGSRRGRGVWHAHLRRCRHSPTLRVDSLLRLAAGRTRPRSPGLQDAAPFPRLDPPDRPRAGAARP